jgi:hypothetical protein
VLPSSGLGWLLLAAKLSRAPAAGQSDSAPFGSRQNEANDHRGTGLVYLGPSLWKAVGLCRVQLSATDPPAALLTAGRRRGPVLLGNGVMPSLFRRV